MSHTITVRLDKDLAEWLEHAAATSGVSQGQLIREQLEKARTGSGCQPFMRLAGSIKGRPRNLSTRKGYSKA
ncbi:MAG: CopG family transcriptional regulator [Vicinamibacterales bacterium]